MPRLRDATRDLSSLLTRGYASPSSLKLVGDRYSLDSRQRLAIARCGCGDQDVTQRQRHQVPTAGLQHHELWIDGYNVLTSIEAALSGGVVHARDGCYRDMASMHGSYRKVAETDSGSSDSWSGNLGMGRDDVPLAIGQARIEQRSFEDDSARSGH